MLVPMMAFLACGGGESGEEAAGEGGAAAAAAPLGSGSISGMVMFTGTAPSNPALDMSDEPQCAERYEGEPTDPVVKVMGGHLANVYVRVSGGLPAGPYPQASEPTVIDQNGCLYQPRVVGVMTGQPLEIRNSDPLLHNIKAVPTENRPFNISQPQAGMTTQRTFNTPEVMVPLECNVHGWMNAFVGVTDHPYFAVSGDDGMFTITGLPAGTYTLEAWHETLGTQTAEVTVQDGAAASVEFTYSG
jgi:plastocyanin